MILTLIAAVGRDGVIGDRGRIPWRHAGDMRHFKATTMGHALIMGRKTFDSIGRALPGRRNIVLTRNPAPSLPEGVLHFNSLEAALQACRETGDREVFVIGGGDVYAQTLPLADRMVLTEVPDTVPGDTRFPHWSRDDWKEVSREKEGVLSFVVYERRIKKS